MNQESRAKIWSETYLTSLLDKKPNPSDEADLALREFDKRFPVQLSREEMIEILEKAYNAPTPNGEKSRFQKQVDEYLEKLQTGNAKSK